MYKVWLRRDLQVLPVVWNRCACRFAKMTCCTDRRVCYKCFVFFSKTCAACLCRMICDVIPKQACPRAQVAGRESGLALIFAALVASPLVVGVRDVIPTSLQATSFALHVADMSERLVQTGTMISRIQPCPLHNATRCKYVTTSSPLWVSATYTLTRPMTSATAPLVRPPSRIS